ncbi:MAG: hypothetical protein J0M08_09270 [Bacteroidetes bacterium]|nr:hypothetical protein [Bacteroidota bacterium]
MPTKTTLEIEQSIERIKELWSNYSVTPTSEGLRLLIEKSNHLHSTFIYLNAYLSINAQNQNTPTEAPKVATNSGITEDLKNTETAAAAEFVARDIRNYIGINEKFMFINQLFNGNSHEYTIALNQINNILSEDELETYLDNLKSIYSWNDEKKDTVESFYQSAYRLFT